MHARPLRLVTALALTAGTALAAAAASVDVAAAAPAFTLPPIGHVWVIELENKSFGESFTPTAGNQYLATTLPSEGALLRNYYGTGHNSLDNYLTEIGGQAPNIYSQGDCPSYIDVTPGTPIPDGNGQVLGQGCVYPSSVPTIAGQLTEHGDTWHGYMEDLGNDPTRDNTSPGDPRCGTPVMNQSDPTQSASATDQYAARHNPFAYFHSLTDAPAGASQSPCQANVGPLVDPTTHVDQLAKDLASVSTTPTFSFITPNLCDDAHDSTCAGNNLAGNTQGGLFAANLWLQKYVPEITSSPAFKKDGVLIVTVDEATNFTVDATSCCNEPSGLNTGPNVNSTLPPLNVLNLPTVVGPGITGPGGGRIGTVVISPFVRPGTVSDVDYNHYALLRSLEDELHLGATAAIPGSDGQGHLGYAGQAGLVTFHEDVFTAVPGASTGTTTTGTPATGAGSASGTRRSSGTGSLAVTGANPLVPVAGVLLVLVGGGLALARRDERKEGGR